MIFIQNDEYSDKFVKKYKSEGGSLFWLQGVKLLGNAIPARSSQYNLKYNTQDPLRWKLRVENQYVQPKKNKVVQSCTNG